LFGNDLSFHFPKGSSNDHGDFLKSMQSDKPEGGAGHLQRTHCPRNTVVLFCVQGLVHWVLKSSFKIFGVSDVSPRQWNWSRVDTTHSIKYLPNLPSVITDILVANRTGCASLLRLQNLQLDSCLLRIFSFK